MEIGLIKDRKIIDEMQESYLDYAMSVIVSRALPDVRDGLKPVHRRILYAMWDIGLKSGAKFRKSATVVGECFVKDTLILTSKGLLPIQDIQHNDLVYTQNGLQKITRLFQMPKKPLLKLTLENGNHNIVTPSQKFKIINSKLGYVWKEAKDLKSTDYIVNRNIFPDIKNEIILSKFGNKTKSLNKDLAYILGFLISDGWLSKEKRGAKYRLGFYSQDITPIKKVQNVFKKEFNYLPTIEIKNYAIKTKQGLKTNKGHTIRICRKEINEFFLNNFNLAGKLAISKEIPKQIFVSPASVIFSFISGLIDGDGCISLKRNIIHYGSISEKLIHGLQTLLQQFEIVGCLSKSFKPSGGIINNKKVASSHKFYNLEFRGKYALKLASKINSYNLSKRQRIFAQQKNALKVSHYDFIPYFSTCAFGELSSLHLGGGWYKSQKGNKFRMGIKYPAGSKIRYSYDLKEKNLSKSQILDWKIYEKLNKIGSSYAELLDKIFKNQISFLRVKSVEKYNTEKTYDLEVENDHEFIANGMVSHNCLGKYHPHGDIAVYDSLVRLAQEFSMRNPLVQGQGNFGSVDGDSAAAMRYTECKLSRIAEEMLFDIEKETVDFTDNYDGSHKEPKVLPAKLPNTLVNGTMGIAVGMATNIPPHNLMEISDAINCLIENKNASIDDLMQFVKGPDFPTGGMIFNKKEILQVYATGKGGITMRGVAEISETKKGAFRIIITEIPYQVNKATMIEKIADLVKNKKIDGIRDIRDESNKDGIRVVIELKKEAFPKKVLNRLYSLTQLQEKFHVNMLALVDGIKPMVLNLKMMLEEYIKHRVIIVTRRAQYDLRKAKDRAHILEGLKKALDHIDEIIKIIKKSASKEIAHQNLVKRFKFSDAQTTAILEMRLSQLAALERQKIEDELKEKRRIIKELETLLASKKKILGVVKAEVIALKEKFGNERQTKVVAGGIEEFTPEDLIPKEDVVISLTRGGYIKSLPEATYHSQKRGGKGVMGMATKEEDVVEHFFITDTHADILFFTNSGKVFQLKAYEIPKATRQAKGQSIVNFLQLSPEEKVTALIALDKKVVAKFIAMVTKQGVIKKVSLEDFSNVRRSGLIAIKINKGDELEWVKPTTGKDQIILITQNGQSIRFKEKDVRAMGRAAAGVRGIRLKGNDIIVSMDIISEKVTKDQKMFVLTENGYGKSSKLSFYKIQGRGGSGVKTAKITAKNGPIVSAGIIDQSISELMIISKKGVVIRIASDAVPEHGRATQGVRIMRMEAGDKVASVAYL